MATVWPCSMYVGCAVSRVSRLMKGNLHPRSCFTFSCHDNRLARLFVGVLCYDSPVNSKECKPRSYRAALFLAVITNVWLGSLYSGCAVSWWSSLMNPTTIHTALLCLVVMTTVWLGSVSVGRTISCVSSLMNASHDLQSCSTCCCSPVEPAYNFYCHGKEITAASLLLMLSLSSGRLSALAAPHCMSELPISAAAKPVSCQLIPGVHWVPCCN
jgi:hypothetical protein